MTIGFLGIGRMGLPMCSRLLAAGHTVTAFDPQPERLAAVVARGAHGAGSMPEAVARADVLITVLPGPPELATAMSGALAAMSAGAVWIDMTSASAAVCLPLQQEAAARGVTTLEAPVGGGVPAAENGTLTFFVGGDAAVLERHRELLAVLGDRVLRVGGPGAGYTTKLLVNLLWFGQAVATAEALLLGQRAGIDLVVLRDALAGSAASSAFIHRDLDALLTGDYLTTFGIDRCWEELAAVTAQARSLDVPFAHSDLVERTYRRAVDRFGSADGELLAVALLEAEAGQLLRSDQRPDGVAD